VERVQRQELVEFLRSRRARLRPEDVGLPNASHRRRTPGLRREEVAQLAAISYTWYTWLEQGRDIHVSAEVLGSLARALRLTESEREYLFLIAGRPAPVPRTATDLVPAPTIQHVLEALGTIPAYVQGPLWDLAAWNEATEAVFADFGAMPVEERNLMRHVFSAPTRTHGKLLNWREWARFYVGQFRVDTARFSSDPRYLALLEDLNENATFAEWWASQDVQGKEQPRPKELEHNDVGLLVLECTTYRIDAQPELTFVLHTPAPGTETAERLTALMASRRAATAA
jgi:transcriptional regulator with XRE-family HTH domain